MIPPTRNVSSGQRPTAQDLPMSPIDPTTTYDAIKAKQDELTFDTAPTEDSTNPVTS
ncbi:MAG: hypothetical protein LBG52_02230 [Candidatus Peribacteria bacterium]|nr:hypothetical protein [Candidatus Peribacteria bacterium]